MSETEIRRHFRAGTELFHEGAAGDCAFIIERGAVHIWTERNGSKTSLATRVAGEIVGEMAIVDNQPRSASATALTDCEMLVLTKAQLQNRVSALDPVMRMVLSVILERFRDSVRRLSGADQDDPATERARAADRAAKHEAAVERIALEQSIKRALDGDEFVLFYQPLVSARTGRVAGFEALARWRHPERGLLGPWAFIDVAEESGLICDISRWALRRACADARRFNAGRRPEDHVFVAVNVTSGDICDPSFEWCVQDAIDAADVPPSNIVLEITESSLVDNPDVAIGMLKRYRDLGVSISVDDFGTGYSSLNYLAKYPVQKLKIDKSFLDELIEEQRSADVVRAMIELAHILKLEVVAEGVETDEQVKMLTAFGCDYLQGYLFSKPVSLEESLALLARYNGCAAA